MNRYPGIRPFRTEEQSLFFGRDADIERLHRLLDLEQIVILYGKSGYGKSSLLSAGIYPKLDAEQQYRYFEIRLGPWKDADSTPPALNMTYALHNVASTHPLDRIFPGERSLWLAIKRLQIPAEPSTADSPPSTVHRPPSAVHPPPSAVHRPPSTVHRFILFFDQFEELFTYPPEQILEFKKQLAEALYSRVPKRLEKTIAAAGLDAETEDALYAPFELKVLFSIRSDRMSLLNGLKDYLPNLLQHAYLLDALDEAQATEAVVAPAALPQFNPTPDPSPTGRGDVERSVANASARDAVVVASPLPVGEGSGVGLNFATPPFSYAPAALDLIFKELRDTATGKIETSALQIVCKHVEDNLVNGGPWTVDGGRPDQQIPNPKSPITISPADLGDIKSIFRQFYDRTIAGLPPAEQPTARHIVEDLLIKDGVRLPFAAQALLAEPGVSPDLLQRLARASLLRVERDEQGRMIYEVGHDTLVAPITEAAETRQRAEAEEAEREKLRLEAERQKEEKQKIERDRRRNIVVGILALALLAFAFFQNVEARKARQAAQAMTDLAKKNEGIAADKTSEAEANLKKAEAEQEKAKNALEEVEIQKDATEEQKRIARQNLAAADRALALARQATADVVQSLLENAGASIHHLRYDEALATLQKAAALGQKKNEVARALMEIAYFRTESGQFEAAKGIVEAAAGLLGKGADLTNFSRNPSGSNLRDALRALDPARFAQLESRYYPDMLKMPGGAFRPGCLKPADCAADSSAYVVTLSDFRLARTEATFWQFALYAASAGRKFTDFSPSWGLDGDNPAVNVSWFDACLYANWLSKQQGLDTVYAISNKRKGSNSDYYDVEERSGANGYRLPTEAEWEWAARGGPNATRTGTYSMTKYAGSDSLDLVGWYWENSSIGGVNRTHPVAGKAPNAPGFYDMSGNVWEWCWDWYGGYPAGGYNNPRGPESGSYRVGRGGAWYNDAALARVSDRDRWYPDDRRLNLGFRLARTVKF